MSNPRNRRSPSIESISTETSMLSSSDENSPGVAIQGSHPVFNLIYEEQKDWLHESEGIRSASLLKYEEQSNSDLAPLAAADVYPMHERFYFPAENIYFLVERVLYSVHRYFFERDSSSFTGQGLSKEKPMVLADISTRDFDLFLSILYPSSFNVYTASTVEEWSSILLLADQWSFESIKALAVLKLTPIASPIDKIVLGRRHNVNHWLMGAYMAVCLQEAPLSLEEGRRLGVDDIIRVNAIRHYHVPDRRPLIIPLSDKHIEDTFKLLVKNTHLAPDKSTSDKDMKSRSQEAASDEQKKKQQEEVRDAGELEEHAQQPLTDEVEAVQNGAEEISSGWGTPCEGEINWLSGWKGNNVIIDVGCGSSSQEYCHSMAEQDAQFNPAPGPRNCDLADLKDSCPPPGVCRKEDEADTWGAPKKAKKGGGKKGKKQSTPFHGTCHDLPTLLVACSFPRTP
ncbi:hypothetical protein HWV62_11183 [Athelia sp. TMB]|nr:hypothetical protein HWV62_11183 [Athelia sp. TMB]